MKYPFFLAFILMAATASSQFNGLKEVQIALLNPPTRNGSIGDIDGDGLQDLVISPNVASFPDLQFLVLRKGIPTPPYFSQNAELLATQFFEIILEDFDGDGDNDAFLYRFSGGTTSTVGVLFMRFNDGAGNFGPFVPLPNEGGSGARRAFTSDVDTDGDVDILYSVVASDSIEFENGMVWLENDGSGAFEAHILSEDESYAIAPIDLDNDGDLDLVESQLFSDQFNFYENIDNEQFVFWASQPSIEFPSEISVGDFNEDGLTDFVSAATDVTRFIAYYENNGTNPPSFTETLVNDFNNRPSTNMVTPDFNGDGHLDIVWSSLNAKNVGWFEGDGQGNFIDRGILLSENQGQTRRLILTELNGDGLPDFINTSNTQNFSGSLINDGNEGLDLVRFSAGGELDDPIMGTTIQADDDFEEELLVLNQGNAVFFIIDDLTMATSTFEMVSSVNYSQLFQAGSVDVEDDGDEDVVVSTDQGLFLFERTNDTYVEIQLSSGDTYDYFELYDVNGDAIGDILALNSATSRLDVLFSDGSGSYGSPVEISDQLEGAIRFAVIEGSDAGDPGILFPQNTSMQLAFIPFLGGENFGAAQVLRSIPFEIELIETGDLNGDSHSDVVIANSTSLQFALNQGANAFGDFEIIENFPWNIAKQVVVGDYSANGFGDILFLRTDGTLDAIRLYENTTEGSFFERQSFLKPRIGPAVTGRFNGDYFEDIAFNTNFPNLALSDRVQVAFNAYPEQPDFIFLPSEVSAAESEKLTAFPNPVASTFRLDHKGIFSGETIDVAIFDLQGKLVEQFTNVHQDQDFDASGLVSGSYRMVVSNSNRRYHIGLTKQ